MNNNNSIFYNPEKLISYNALLNFIIGARGCGKTYGFKKLGVNRFIKSSEQFVYIRRYNSELEGTNLNHFFDPLIRNHEFDDYALTVKNRTFMIDDCEAGFAMNLSTARTLKSNEYTGVKTIIFDEFLIDRGSLHYLPNEVFEFLDIIETIARLRDIRVFCLGNAITKFNPYFSFFNISMPYGSAFKTFKDGLIAIEIVNNEAYRDKKNNSRFGRLVAGTPYGNYAVENKFKNDDPQFLRKKSGNCHNYSVLVINGLKVGVWQDNKANWYISEDFDPSNPCLFACDFKSHDEKTILINARRSPWFGPVLSAYKVGKLFFESEKVKNPVIQLLEKCLHG